MFSKLFLIPFSYKNRTILVRFLFTLLKGIDMNYGRPLSTVLWGDIFAVVSAFEQMYDVVLRWKFVGAEGDTYRGKGVIVLEAFDKPEGYSHALLGSKSKYYEQREGMPVDQVMYELLLAIEPLLRDINNHDLPFVP